MVSAAGEESCTGCGVSAMGERQGLLQSFEQGFGRKTSQLCPGKLRTKIDSSENDRGFTEIKCWLLRQCNPPNPFDDLRRTEALRSEGNMIPPKIRKRLAKLEGECT